MTFQKLKTPVYTVPCFTYSCETFLNCKPQIYHPPVLVIQSCISLFFHRFGTYELFFLSKGFLPTYGPCWVNLYGSTRQYSLLNENQHLNDGLGEGVSYRGRMLISLRTEVIESADLGGPATVEVCSALPISDVSGLCINALYIKYCKCIAVCCELYDGFFVRFSNCS